MGYQPHIKSHKSNFKKPYRLKVKDKKRNRKDASSQILNERPIPTEKEISQATLKRLHTLGIQKFGSSPFSQHFDRWLTNVADVIAEFQANPNIGVDDQFINECKQAISTIKLSLENRRHREDTVDQQIKLLSACRDRLKQINTQYATELSQVKTRKKAQLRRLYREIEQLKEEQEKIIQLKTGILHIVSKKKKEQKEAEINQQINNQQRELELFILEFGVAEKQLRDEHDQKKEPVLEQIKFYRKEIKPFEEDGSLEDRWFACEALIDAVNSFLQRKTAQSRNSLKADSSGT
jgi:hypothetical protein